MKINGIEIKKKLINIKDSKVKDDIGNEARELCKQIKGITEEDLKDGSIVIGDFVFRYNDDDEFKYEAINTETGEYFVTKDFENLKRVIKYSIYMDDKYFSEKADEEAEAAINRREAEVDWPGNRTMDYQSKELSNKRIDEIPLQARKELKENPNKKKAILVAYEGAMDDIIEGADPSIKEDLKSKKDKILKDLKEGFQIEDSKYDYIDLKDDIVTIHYNQIPVTAQYLISKETWEEPADYGEEEVKIDYDYIQTKDDIWDALQWVCDDEEVTDENFAELLKKHEKELIEYMKDFAIDEAQETFDSDEYYRNKAVPEMKDSETETAYIDKDGTLVLHYIFKSNDSETAPYGYVPNMGEVLNRLYSYSKDSDEFGDIDVGDYEKRTHYIYAHLSDFIEKYKEYVLEDFRDDAEDEFYAKLWDNED